MSNTFDNKKALSDLALLEELLRKNPEALKAAKKIVHQTQERQHATRVPTVKQHKLVNKQVVCMHCGTIHLEIVRLEPKEHTSVVRQDGTYREVHFSIIDSGVAVKTYTGRCKSCPDHIHQLDREALERKYAELLQVTDIRRFKP